MPPRRTRNFRVVEDSIAEVVRHVAPYCKWIFCFGGVGEAHDGRLAAADRVCLEVQAPRFCAPKRVFMNTVTDDPAARVDD